jgi:hypothetical protein
LYKLKLTVKSLVLNIYLLIVTESS